MSTCCRTFTFHMSGDMVLHVGSSFLSDSIFLYSDQVEVWVEQLLVCLQLQLEQLNRSCTIGETLFSIKRLPIAIIQDTSRVCFQ